MDRTGHIDEPLVGFRAVTVNFGERSAVGGTYQTELDGRRSQARQAVKVSVNYITKKLLAMKNMKLMEGEN